ncbi:MAG: chromosome segregation protein SMC [Chromatiales bacterium]|jgi:chromosome segregation protein
MRLEKIKISGFKSFVDPTAVILPSNLVGVIGPNGCGKSNVIDAVRWVMGETSAKMLRGESMADVIFNGSTSRKPVGAASIELVFDNSDGKISGEYAKYNQISVKRKVTRDGQSNYFLNSVRCRRRDITDIFLGTGLGPRSYSIIEQGMISRFVEAKPEELRNFLEEAAGISKYKERRRETENRIAHTRENLERLTDLREEVAKQLQHLERQAATAEKYKLFKQEERQRKAELLALQWKKLDEELAQRDRKLAEMENVLQSVITEQRRFEADIELQRDAHHDANDGFNQVQGEFYAIGADIARLEEGIQYAKNARSQQQNDLQQIEQAWLEAQDHFAQDQAREAELKQQLESEEPRFAEQRKQNEILHEQLESAEHKLQQWQHDWDEFNEKATEPAQLAQVERTRINHIEQQEQQYARRLEKIREEQGRLDATVFEREIDQLSSQIESSEAKVRDLEQQLEQVLQTINDSRQQNQQTGNTLNQLRSSQQTWQGRLASLEALQQDALGKQQGQVAQWLEKAGLDHAGRLLENISVASEWQTAVETVLGFYLQSVNVDSLDQVGDKIAELQKGQLTLIETGGSAPAEASANSLLQHVKSDLNLASLLQHVQTANNLPDALGRRHSLQTHESIVTRDGVWLGSNWLRVNRVADEQGGMIAREQEINELREKLANTAAELKQLEQQQAEAREAVRTAEQQREQLQRQLNADNRQLGDLRGSIASKKARVESIHNRLQGLNDECAEIEQQISSGKELSEQSRARLHQALHEMESHSTRRDELVAQRDALRQTLQETRERYNRDKQQSHELELRIEAMRTSLDSLLQHQARMSGQLEHLQQRKQSLSESLDQSEQPLIEQQRELESCLEKRLAVETTLSEARKKLGDIEADLRELEQGRSTTEQRVQDEREKITQAKMQRQETLVHYQSHQTQINETGFTTEELFAGLPGDASVADWREQVEALERKIIRLGAINLAAIDEFKEQSERMAYLDKQNEDISESLETLENAIKKIDRETRTRFKETFDYVDSGLKELFPKLFGGGHAYLQLTGEDVLDAGVSIMARPPGKRNSSIHLLSGGEKALTAVALVFAIFQLNPAPFCMLDEVDAPLDDANVGRFCDMVKEMSEKVQFVFITHNKVTMEIANQLMGVTMHEPGVSRLVSVDIDEAAKLAVV